MSDIHTEFFDSQEALNTFQESIHPRSSFLILAGDIGAPFSKFYESFSAHLSEKFQHIFIISGNHEYYTQRKFIKQVDWMAEVDDQIRHVCSKFPNVTYLQNQIYHIPDTNIAIFGSTFWSDIQPEEEMYIQYSLNDYECIPFFTTAEARRRFKIACSLLGTSLELHPDKDFIVVSHHLPSLSLVHPKYFSGPITVNSAYASDIQLAEHPRIRAWVAGHTHTPIQKGKFYVNPLGYPGENAVTNIIQTFTI